MLSLVSFAGMTLDKSAVLRIGTLTEGPLCRESHPIRRLKNPTVAFILSVKPVCTMCACSLSSRDPSDRDVNWRPPVQGQSPPVQVKKKHSTLQLIGSVVARWLAHWPLVPEVMGSIPVAGEIFFSVTEHALIVSFAGMTQDKCAVLRIGTLTGGPLCRECHPMCRFKNHTVAFILQKTVCTMYVCSLSSRDPSDRDVNWRPPVQGVSSDFKISLNLLVIYTLI